MTKHISYCDKGKILLKVIALIGINLLALVYDSQWLYYAIGVNAMVLGFEIGDRIRIRRREDECKE